MPQVELSVIIPVFNGARTLPRCIDALRAQTLPRDRFEIIVADNNSTDGSADIARRYHEVKLLQEPKQGAYAARNRAAASATGSILVFTDPDCVPRPDWLESIARAMESDGVDILLGGYVPPAHSSALRLLVLYENTKDAFVFGTGIPELYYGHTNNMAVRRRTFDAYGPFIERRRGADTIFVRGVVEKEPCSVVRYDPGMLVEHLEVDDVWTYYRKMATYGHSRESYRALAWTRPLTLRERLTVLRRARAENRLNVVRSMQLVMLLAMGLVAWRSGRARAQLRKLFGASPEIVPPSTGIAPEADRSTLTP
jgi:glycosyltransferase involved in cell wall biosynthesis